MASGRNRALVVDDEGAMQKIVARELNRRGFDCDLASDGDQAIDMLDKNAYQVVVADLRMPGLNGHFLAQQILQRPKRPCLVIHTGVTDPRLAKDLMARGVDDILFKPVDISFLAMKVRTLVDRANGGRAKGAISSPLVHSKKAESDALGDDMSE